MSPPTMSHFGLRPPFSEKCTERPQKTTRRYAFLAQLVKFFSPMGSHVKMKIKKLGKKMKIKKNIQKFKNHLSKSRYD